MLEVFLPTHFIAKPPKNAFDENVSFKYRTSEPVELPDIEVSEYMLPTLANKIKGTKKADSLKGTQLADRIDGKRGTDTLKGGRGNDLLIGSQGNDYLNGSKGSDYLNGSEDSDTLMGAGGADVFQLSEGSDTVEDFNIEQGDRIALDETGVFEVFDVTNAVIVQNSTDNQLLLLGVDVDEFVANAADLFVQPV